MLVVQISYGCRHCYKNLRLERVVQATSSICAALCCLSRPVNLTVTTSATVSIGKVGTLDQGGRWCNGEKSGRARGQQLLAVWQCRQCCENRSYLSPAVISSPERL